MFETVETEANQDDSLKEGHLYVMRDGALEEIEKDPDDILKKVRILDEAVEKAVVIQRKVRKQLGGYKPDLSMVISALVIAKANNEEESIKAVKELFADISRRMLAE